jgi:hypothetical protein
VSSVNPKVAKELDSTIARCMEKNRGRRYQRLTFARISSGCEGVRCQGAGIFEAGAALREAFFGNAAAARDSAKRALRLSKGRKVECGAGLALAIPGDSSMSLTLAQDLEKRFPEDTSVRFSYLPAVLGLP